MNMLHVAVSSVTFILYLFSVLLAEGLKGLSTPTVDRLRREDSCNNQAGDGLSENKSGFPLEDVASIITTVLNQGGNGRGLFAAWLGFTFAIARIMDHSRDTTLPLFYSSTVSSDWNMQGPVAERLGLLI